MILAHVSDEIRNKDLDKGPKKTQFRSNTSIIPQWAQVHETKEDFVGEGSTHGGREDFLYGVVRYKYPSSA